MNIYDFDGTIYDGDSSIDFFKYCLKNNKKILFDVLPICFSCVLYILKIYKKEQMKSSFFRFLKRIPVNNYVDSFWVENEYKIKLFYRKQKQPSDIIISASPEFLLKPIAKKYNFTLIATKVDVDSGKIIGKNCHGENKVDRLKKIGITECNKFYSDSLSDLPCAKIAKNAYIVKKEKIVKWERVYEQSK